MSELASAIFAGIAAGALAVAYIAFHQAAAARTARRRAADDHRQRMDALLRALHESQTANDRLAGEVRRREQAIGELLDRMNRATVAAVAASRTQVLSLPAHRVEPRQFSRN